MDSIIMLALAKPEYDMVSMSSCVLSAGTPYKFNTEHGRESERSAVLHASCHHASLVE